MNPDRPIPNITRGVEITTDLDLSCDVCIVGSGPGGSIAAAKLAAAGAKVVVLEEGGYFVRKDFDLQEARAIPSLYQEYGNRATEDLSITILQGRGIGGGTLVNWTTSYRTPDVTLSRWRSDFGLSAFTPENLNPHWDEIERRLSIHEVTPDEINENNRVLWDGARKLGYGVELLKRNVNRCAHTGFCGLGCPTNAKQAMYLTYLPDAAEKGARIYANCRVLRLLADAGGKRIESAEAEVLEGMGDGAHERSERSDRTDRSERSDRATGRRVVVKAKAFVLSGGAINTPALLLRSALPDPHGRVGKRTWLHPVVATIARFAKRIDPFYGAPQSVASHHFAERPGKLGYFLETPPLQPMLASIALAGSGPEHRRRMEQLPRLNAVIALLRDGFLDQEEGGTIALRGDRGRRLAVRYPLTELHFEAMREAMKTMARIQFAAGALEVSTLHQPALALRTPRDIDLIDRRPMAPNRVGVFTAHQMGGCGASSEPTKGVVNGDLRHHHLENLFVFDGSVFPTSLGVNPQESVLGVSSWATDRLIAAGWKG